MKQLLQWIAIDGLLHFLVCYATMMTFTPIIGAWWAIGIAGILAIAKEAWDYFYERDNNIKQVFHDLICDLVGIIGALIVMFVAQI